MSLERWEQVQRQKGNIAGVEMARVLREQFGDVPLQDGVKAETRSTGKPDEISDKDSEAYRRAREALEKKGMTVFVIKPKSVAQLLAEKGQYFGYVINSRKMRDFVPEAMEVAIDTNQLAIPKSGDLSLDRHRAMVSEYERALKKETGLKGIKAVMTHASVYSQLDIAYQEQNPGKVLFPDFFARTIDKTVGSSVAFVGRFFPDDLLYVYNWHAVFGPPDVRAVPVVVLPPRK